MYPLTHPTGDTLIPKPTARIDPASIELPPTRSVEIVVS